MKRKSKLSKVQQRLTRKARENKRRIEEENRSFQENLINSLLTEEKFIEILLSSIPSLKIKFKNHLDTSMLNNMSLYKKFKEAAEKIIDERMEKDEKPYGNPVSVSAIDTLIGKDDDDDDDDEEDDDEEDDEMEARDVLREIIEDSLEKPKVKKAIEEIKIYIIESIRKELMIMLNMIPEVEPQEKKTKPKTRKTPYLT